MQMKALTQAWWIHRNDNRSTHPENIIPLFAAPRYYHHFSLADQNIGRQSTGETTMSQFLISMGVPHPSRET